MTNGGDNELLYRIFENVLVSEGMDARNSIAVWHVPDPRRLRVSSKPLLTLPPHCDPMDLNGKTNCTYDENIISVTFHELNARANRLASKLATVVSEIIDTRKFDQTTGPDKKFKNDEITQEQANTIVVLLMPPGIDRIIAQIGCMKLHLAYTLVDRQLSTGRIVQKMEKIRPVLIVISRDYFDGLFLTSAKHSNCFSQQAQGITKGNHRNDGALFFSGKLELLRNALKNNNTQIFEDLLDCRWSTTNGKHLKEATTDSPIQIGDDSDYQQVKRIFPHVLDPVVIVLLTSGSTKNGRKIVRLRNHQLYNRLMWQRESNAQLAEDGQWGCNNSRIPDMKNEISLASTACMFVDAFTEMFSALFSGIPIVVPGGSNCASEVCVSDVQILSRLLSKFRITRLTTVPIQLNTWLKQICLISPKERIKDFSTLETVVVSGDVLLPQLAHDFFQIFSEHSIRLLNFYGTTEVAGDVTAAVFHNESEVRQFTKTIDLSGRDGNVLKGTSFLTVGRPISNCAIYVVKKCLCQNCSGSLGTNGTNKEACETMSTQEINSHINQLAVIGNLQYTIDWQSLGYRICDKGSVGEVVIAGVPVYNCRRKWITNQQISGGGVKRRVPTTVSDDLSLVNFPGDLGFVCPDDNLLYICGRSDELIKINAVGFLAGNVDHLIDGIKKWCVQRPSEMSRTELKLSNVIQTVTLPIRHPVNESQQVVCFYVVDRDRNFTESGIALQLNNKLQTMSTTLEGEPLPYNYQLSSAVQLSSIMANYLPVYIKPVFFQVNYIPVMPTSGKTDKQRLRTFYEDTVNACYRLNAQKNNNGTARITPVESENCDDNVDHFRKTNSPLDMQQEARRVLARVLGLDVVYGGSSIQRPRDDEDFYILGGNSLMAVLALENLRQLGYKVSLETFYHTGNIGKILRSLVAPKREVCNPSLKHTDECEEEDVNWLMNFHSHCISSDQDTTIVVCECRDIHEGNNDMGLSTVYEDIVEVLVDSFSKKDTVSKALLLDRKDIEVAARTYVSASMIEPGIILAAAEVKNMDSPSGFPSGKIFGALVAIPSVNVPQLPMDKKLNLLERYFSFASAPDAQLSPSEPSPCSDLSVIMVGISPSVQPTQALIQRNLLEVLAMLEAKLLQIAKRKGFSRVETLNTSEITKEVCANLGYEIIKSTRMQSFSETESIDLDPKYYEHHGYHMVRYLDSGSDVCYCNC
ncbi:unnamed protein product [Calicophoron daubneyi]|uniref:AMP-dependent synthetase/ligase domain-containing protein n=1 Tax=Calicophoron daubneyi TaxID=300641 RepID=A0AAV2TB44_CALDB